MCVHTSHKTQHTHMWQKTYLVLFIISLCPSNYEIKHCQPAITTWGTIEGEKQSFRWWFTSYTTLPCNHPSREGGSMAATSPIEAQSSSQYPSTYCWVLILEGHTHGIYNHMGATNGDDMWCASTNLVYFKEARGVIELVTLLWDSMPIWLCLYGRSVIAIHRHV